MFGKLEYLDKAAGAGGGGWGWLHYDIVLQGIVIKKSEFVAKTQFFCKCI